MTEREIAEIAEVLLAVPTVCGSHRRVDCAEAACIADPHSYPDHEAMARAVAGLINEQAARHADCCVDRQELADRDARLARLGEALRTVRFTLTALPTLYPQLKASEAVSKAVEIADVALADAGAGKERGDG